MVVRGDQIAHSMNYFYNYFLPDLTSDSSQQYCLHLWFSSSFTRLGPPFSPVFVTLFPRNLLDIPVNKRILCELIGLNEILSVVQDLERISLISQSLNPCKFIYWRYTEALPLWKVMMKTLHTLSSCRSTSLLRGRGSVCRMPQRQQHLCAESELQLPSWISPHYCLQDP